MKFTPYDFQQEGIDHLFSNKEAALWFEMGLGKTPITLSVISQLILEGASRGALIVAPFRVLILAWMAQGEKWQDFQWLRFANLRTPEGMQAWEDGSADIYLINAERLPSTNRTVKGKTKKTPGIVERLIKGRKRIPVDTIVFDELSLFKGGGVRFKAIAPFLHDIVDASGNVKYRTPFIRKWGLTGTPASNSYLDLFYQVKLLDGGKRLGRSITQYKDTYFNSDFMGWSHTPKDGAKEKIDAKLADLALVKLSADHLDIPPCTVEDVDVALPSKVMKQYRELEKEFLVELDSGEIEALSAAALTTKLLQITSGCVFDSERGIHALHDAKIKALEKIVKTHKREPILVFTSYTHERERLMKAFPQAVKFHEDDMPKWKRGEIPMWVTDWRSMSHGVDGAQEGGRIIVWTTPTWSNEGESQSNARIARNGQKKSTIIYRILASNTVDWAVAEAVKNKQEGQSGLMEAVKNLRRLRENGV